MSQPGSHDNPLRVAIIGAGPAGFYTAERLYKEKNLHVQVDMFDRLPTPFGLVRAGVAPDHQKIKSVTKVFERVAAKPGFRFFGNVTLGEDVSVEELRHYYHQIVYTTGAQTDRSLNIPGIDLTGSHAATEFVAWYNGHPDYRDYQFDLSQENVVVIGIGNVAVDVARILCRTPEELKETDIADYALEALRHSKVKHVYMLGRRGPAQAAFTPVEAKELGEMMGADVHVLPEEAELDELSQASLAEADRGTTRNVEIVQEFAERPSTGKPRQLTIRFMVSPTELLGDEQGQVTGVRIAKTELYKTDAGSLRSRSTDKTEVLPAGLVFRSIGYRGVPLPGVPFNESWGVILNEGGRVIDAETQQPVVGEYTAGWIKRGPSGVIGTNKPDAAETAERMLEDLAAGSTLQPAHPDAEAFAAFIGERQPQYVSFADWQKLDELELANGVAQGRPRLKFVRVADMLAALGK
ncbi:MAG: FAD-dependent oxidoreductase [Ardenticatenaceae bacterium]|nr:FAD-dependent oxidoreductase [Ardenticatenaceae bacterium]